VKELLTEAAKVIHAEHPDEDGSNVIVFDLGSEDLVLFATLPFDDVATPDDLVLKLAIAFAAMTASAAYPIMFGPPPDNQRASIGKLARSLYMLITGWFSLEQANAAEKMIRMMATGGSNEPLANIISAIKRRECDD